MTMTSMGMILNIDFDRHISLVNLITNGSQKIRYARDRAITKIANEKVLMSIVLVNS